MRNMRRLGTLLIAGAALLSSGSGGEAQDPAPQDRVLTAIERLRGEAEGAKEAIQQLVNLGETALPKLRAAAGTDPVFLKRVKTVISRITGQWGSDGRLIWKRSMEEARKSNVKGRPILVLQLFGKFDEEFC